MKHFWQKEEEGYSLVELIITIGIAAILTSMIALTMGILSSADSSGLRTKVDSAFNELKSQNMAKAGTTYMYLFYDSSDGSFRVAYDNFLPANPTDTYTFKTLSALSGTGKKVGKMNNVVKLNGASTSLKDATAPWVFTISKKDGAFKVVKDSAGNVITPILDGKNVITVQSEAGGAIYSATFIKDTGKHYTD